MAYVNTTRAAGFGLIERIQEFRATALEAAGKRKIYRETYRELNNLSNRELADLGLHRSAIKGIAYEAAYAQ